MSLAGLIADALLFLEHGSQRHPNKAKVLSSPHVHCPAAVPQEASFLRCQMWNLLMISYQVSMWRVHQHTSLVQHLQAAWVVREDLWKVRHTNAELAFLMAVRDVEKCRAVPTLHVLARG
jgi:hypothetical protein